MPPVRFNIMPGGCEHSLQRSEERIYGQTHSLPARPGRQTSAKPWTNGNLCIRAGTREYCFGDLRAVSPNNRIFRIFKTYDWQLAGGCTSAGSRSIIPDESGLAQGVIQPPGVGRAIFSSPPGSYFVSWLLLATILHLLPDSGRRNAADAPCWPAGGATSQGR